MQSLVIENRTFCGGKQIPILKLLHRIIRDKPFENGEKDLLTLVADNFSKPFHLSAMRDLGEIWVKILPNTSDIRRDKGSTPHAAPPRRLQ